MDAIVLSGGAAYGAYEVGVLKALSEKKGFDPEIVTGTSVGAFNAAIVASESIARLEEIWRDEIPEHGTHGNGVMRVRGNPLPYLNPPQPANLISHLIGDSVFLTRIGIKRGEAFLTSEGGAASRLSELVDLSAFITCEPLRHTIRRTLSFERLRQTTKKLRIIATDWQEGVARIFSNEDITDADGESIILASTAIPGIFPPVRLEGKVFVDGGVVMNTPLKPALKAGADTIHVVSLDPTIRKIETSEYDNTLESIMRVLQISIGSAVREDITTASWINAGIDVLMKMRRDPPDPNVDLADFIRVADQLRQRAAAGTPYKRVTIHHYQPSHGLGSPIGLLDFTSSNIERLIATGYEDTLRHMCNGCGCVLPLETAAPDVMSASSVLAS